MTLFQEEYNQGNGKNLTSKLEEELIEVRRILMKGVQKLIDRGERLDELIRKTQNLEISVRKSRHIFLFPPPVSFFNRLLTRDFV